jgi:predicted  nucleic acid-binding Zn-ribbon protein|tara:strand:+ start:16 stop:288 length:273 start_codon:yes stop_codon:yes gene_type:complete
MKKVKSIKAEEAKIQITTEQLATIKKQQEDISQLLKDVGFLETQKHTLNHKYAVVAQEIEEYKAELEKEYGAVNISLEDGTCTAIEEKSE